MSITSTFKKNKNKTKNPKTTPKPKKPHNQAAPPTEEKLRQASEIGIIKGSLQLTSAF